MAKDSPSLKTIAKCETQHIPRDGNDLQRKPGNSSPWIWRQLLFGSWGSWVCCKCSFFSRTNRRKPNSQPRAPITMNAMMKMVMVTVPLCGTHDCAYLIAHFEWFPAGGGGGAGSVDYIILTAGTNYQAGAETCNWQLATFFNPILEPCCSLLRLSHASFAFCLASCSIPCCHIAACRYCLADPPAKRKERKMFPGKDMCSGGQLSQAQASDGLGLRSLFLR